MAVQDSQDKALALAAQTGAHLLVPNCRLGDASTLLPITVSQWPVNRTPWGSFFEFDDVGAVVDADGTELAQDVLAEEAVKLGPDALREIVQIHHRDRLGK